MGVFLEFERMRTVQTDDVRIGGGNAPDNRLGRVGIDNQIPIGLNQRRRQIHASVR